jgi:hypothetical protein
VALPGTFGGKTMPETEADRILQERLRQKETQERRKQAEAAHQARITYLKYLDEIRAEINTVLRLLAELNYPFMQEVRFRKEHDFILFSLFDHYVTKAGWAIGSHTYEIRGDPIAAPIYLLSDGRLCVISLYGNSVGSPEKIIGSYGRPSSYDSTGCLKGLHDLRRKLEELNK